MWTCVSSQSCHVLSTHPHPDPALFDQLGAADIIYNGRRVGVIGVVHPEVLVNFGLKNPCGMAV